MIIFDYSQLVLSGIFEQIGPADKNIDIDTFLVRSMFFNILKGYTRKFKLQYGPEIVIACDSRNYWRKEFFPNYKSNRKKTREKMEFNWSSIFDAMNTIKAELKQYSPYKIIEVDGAEADDVIAVISEYAGEFGQVLIISSDKDFVQLQTNTNIKQYSPIQKKFLLESNPELFLKQKIIKGDSIDGIPSILSGDNTFVDGIRQKPITEKKMTEWLSQNPILFCDDTMLKYFTRNEILIDFKHIPTEIVNGIIGEYNDVRKQPKLKFLNYMIEYNLKNHIPDIGDF